MGAKHSLGSPELSFRRPNSRDHLHSQRRGSSPHKPCSPSARATFSSQAHEFLPGGSQKLWVRLLPSPEKQGFANLFCSVTLWHTQPWRSAHAPLSRFPSQTGKTVNLCLQGNLLMFSLRSQKYHQVPGDKHCSLSKAARNGSHYSLQEQCRHSQEICSSHRCCRARTMTTEPRAEEQQPLNCTYFTSDSKHKQALKMPFFCLHLPLCCCAVALWTQPCRTTSH